SDKINQVHPLKDGLSIRAIHAQKKDLAGTKIKLRGLVTKYNAEIMGKNWLHIRDASTGDDGDDLVATTAETFTVGDVVVLEGTVTLDQNFGFGYSYELLLTEATRIQEP
ncbi:MAG: nucleotide-binding protein, partial [FCB group bacterium]|nr:nucleotide-binding protein [FCB group bacterium]